jgi:hypothetical protein
MEYFCCGTTLHRRVQNVAASVARGQQSAFADCAQVMRFQNCKGTPLLQFPNRITVELLLLLIQHIQSYCPHLQLVSIIRNLRTNNSVSEHKASSYQNCIEKSHHQEESTRELCSNVAERLLGNSDLTKKTVPGDESRVILVRPWTSTSTPSRVSRTWEYKTRILRTQWSALI